MSTTQGRDWYNIAGAAKRLGFSAPTIRNLLKARLLGCRKVGPCGGRYQITEAHVLAYLESCEVEVEAKPTKAAGPEKPAAKPAATSYGRRGRVERLDGKPPKFY